MSSTVIAGSTRTPDNRGITKNAGSAGGGEYRNARVQKVLDQGAVENTRVGTSARYPGSAGKNSRKIWHAGVGVGARTAKMRQILGRILRMLGEKFAGFSCLHAGFLVM
jgi:hypothetical protein